MAAILFACGHHLEGIIPEVTAAADYFRAAGHRVALLMDGAAAEEALTQEAPDVLVTTEWVPPRDAFHMTSALRTHHPGAGTGVILLVHTIGPHGEPNRYWPQLIHSYVMAAGGRWQFIMAVEQLLHLQVTGVTGVRS
jgi:hypothetical protein